MADRQRASGADRLPPLLVALALAPPDQVLRELKTSLRGLSPVEVAARRKQYGINAVAHQQRLSLLRQILTRLRDPLNVLLLSLATLSIVTGDREAPTMILVMVILSLSLSLLQERRSGRAAEALRAMVHTTATVVRESPPSDPLGAADPARPADLPREIALRELVPGDIVKLSAGDLIPADLRLLTAKDLFINQSTLTGEALPAEKHAQVIDTAATEIAALSNICFMGTTVLSGTATAVVALTGENAYFGGVAAAIAGQRAATSFDRGIARFAWLMIRFIAVMAPVVFLINGFTKGDWLQALLFSAAVAVGLTPEMLPMIVTVNLAKGAMAMAARRVIVKRLNSIQDFGAMDVLCTDKTGTLTQDRVLLEKHVDLLGNDSLQVLEYAWLNSRYQSGLHNLLDVAVLEHPDVRKLADRADSYRKVDEVPFDFERRRMSVAVEGNGHRLLICKGAVEEVYAVCSEGLADGSPFPLDSQHLTQLRSTANQLNSDGFRVIAVAIRSLPAAQESCGLLDERQMTLVGYIAFLDPPKDSAAAALEALRAHGVRVKVLTGDNEVITGKICREVGLPVQRIVLGAELAGFSPAQLAAAVEEAQVFAKLAPMQKAQVIKALQANRHVVGFLGDGINDGPALKSADVGISVDSAVDIAKESADIILLDKSLLVLDQGVLEGRKVFANVIKYIRMGASSNFGNMFSVLGASAWLPFLPMAPIQVLTNNLLYDISQTAIPTDHVDPEFLTRPRRWQITDISRYMLFIGPISSIFDYATYFIMYFVFGARTPAGASLFQTGWFVESVLSQTLIIHILRTQRLAFVESHASLPLTVMSVAVCMVAMALPYSPAAAWLGFTPLPAAYWPMLAAMVVAYLVLTHVMKRWLAHRFNVY